VLKSQWRIADECVARWWHWQAARSFVAAPLFSRLGRVFCTCSRDENVSVFDIIIISILRARAPKNSPQERVMNFGLGA
jgi:hypothetical protein